jgi:hypothetical protein
MLSPTADVQNEKKKGNKYAHQTGPLASRYSNEK